MNPVTSRISKRFASKSVLSVCLLWLGLTACAQDKPVLDQVQPNYLDKQALLGKEWYVRTTVVQGNFTNAMSFAGSMGSLERGVFDVQEKALYFYRTYEFLLGSEQYAQKSDTDVAMKDAQGQPIRHAVPQDYQKISCTSDSDCTNQARCAGSDHQGGAAWSDEEDYTGFCVHLATRYIYQGAPVMAFPISSHFDIAFSYSPATGEKTNVRVENTSDRLWFDRQYIRVQWGNHQIFDYATNPLPNKSTVVYQGDTGPEGDRFETGIDHKQVGPGTGDFVDQHYISYITNEIHNAAAVKFTDGSVIPACYIYPWYIGGVYDCNSESYKIRTFFLEVPKYPDVKMNYVARDQDDVEMTKFGFFRTERQTYDIQFGNDFHNAIRRLQRHRIWDRYVKKLQPDGSWQGDFDYTQMTPQPIVYYVNEDHPRELLPASVDIAKSWSPGFEDVVKYHKKVSKLDHPMFVLCENSNASALTAVLAGGDYSKGQVAEHGDLTAIGTAQAEALLAAKQIDAAGLKAIKGALAATPHSQLCRNMDETHQFGDLRYNVMHAIPAPAQNSLYGYGPSAADPISGEIIAASAHSYVAAMKIGAEAGLQALEFMAGVTDFNDVERASQKRYNIKAQTVKRFDLKGPKSLEEMQQAAAGLLDADVRAGIENMGMQPQSDGDTWAQSRMANLQKNPQIDALASADDDGHSIRALFKDYSAKPGQEKVISADELQTLSLSQWAHTAGLQAQQKVYDQLATKTLHFAEFKDGALVGLAKEKGALYDAGLCKRYATEKGTLFTFDSGTMAATTESCTTVGAFESKGLGIGRVCVGSDKPVWAPCSARLVADTLREALNSANGGDPNADIVHTLPGPLYTDTADPLLRHTQELGRAEVDQLRSGIRTELWQRIYEDTQLHEIGHTLGLRHNFEASTDSLNFHKEFWDLRLDDAGKPLALLQPETDAQTTGHLREKQLASVMDYTAKFNGRFAGIGLYDLAAIRFGYGDLVDTFTKPPTLDKPVGNLPAARDFLATPADSGTTTTMNLVQGVQDMYKLTRRIHWSSWPAYFGSDKASATAAMYDRTIVDWHDIRGNRCNADNDCGDGRVCRPLGALSAPAAGSPLINVDQYCMKSTRSDGTALVEVPYRFCSDEYNGQTPSCATFDEGVDAYEIATNALNDYEDYWFFWGYARDNEMFQPDNYSNRVARQFGVAQRQFQYWAIDLATYQKNGWWKARYGNDYDQDINGGLSGSMATMNTFNTLAQVLARPTPGYYFLNATKNQLEQYNAVDQAKDDTHWIDEPEGARPLYAGWGGGYAVRPLTAGQFYDRLAAFVALSDPSTSRYIGVNENEDTRRYLVNFYSVFPRQMFNLFAGIQVDDIHYYGWYMIQGPRAADGTSLGPDSMLRRAWVGPNAGKEPPLCSTLVNLPPDQQTGCLKYAIYPDARPTFPSSRFRMPLLGAIYGMSFLTRTFERSYMDLSRVFLQGNQHQIDFPDSVSPTDIIKFTDPLSGKTYVSAKVDSTVLNPGYIAVQQAQAVLSQFADLKTLQDNYLFSEYQYRVSLLEIVRSMHEMFEY